MVAALRSAAVAVAALALWAQPAQAQLRGAAADAADDAAAAAGDEDVDTASMQIRIIGHSLLLAGGIDHFHEVFQCVRWPCLARPPPRATPALLVLLLLLLLLLPSPLRPAD
eukprot:COSAG06_NODE_2143_length_7484_cov_6.113067_3_plen_112_part_00